MKQLIIIWFLILGNILTISAQSELTGGIMWVTPSVEFASTINDFRVETTRGQPSSSFPVPVIEYRRYLDQIGEFGVFIAASYYTIEQDIFIGGGIAGRGFTKMQFNVLPIDLGASYTINSKFVFGVNANVTVLSSLNATEYDFEPLDQVEVIDGNNQLLAVGGFVAYRLWDRVELRTAYTQGLAWRQQESRSTIGRFSGSGEYWIDPISAFSISLRYVLSFD